MYAVAPERPIVRRKPRCCMCKQPFEAVVEGQQYCSATCAKASRAEAELVAVYAYFDSQLAEGCSRQAVRRRLADGAEVELTGAGMGIVDNSSNREI